MKRLPPRPNLAQLKKQAKELFALYKSGEPDAINRFRSALPAAAAKDDRSIADLNLRLADAQSCLAREYGFRSWADLSDYVAARNARATDRAASILNLLRLIYAGDVTGGNNRARPSVAARIIEESPGLLGDDPWLACAVGDVSALRQKIAEDFAWVDRPGGPLGLPPLVAVTHSSLMRLPAFRDNLHASARFLLESGVDPDQSVTIQWSASPDAPSNEFRLSALYGAAGQNRDPELTRLLLQAGANPNDGESLYHSLENPTCTQLLLEAGARVTGSNALCRALDLDDAEPLHLLLAHGGDPNEPASGPPTSDWGTPLLWAIRRRRSPAHVEALLAAGADPSVKTPNGMGAYDLALKFGLPNVANLLRQHGAVSGSLTQEDEFVAACACCDEARAREILSRRPDILGGLSDMQLRTLPELAAQGCGDAVRLMVALGWPIATRGGDWNASALNHAVFRGDTGLVQFLLQHGASWRERHGFGDNACGTLSWASLNEPVDRGDWPGCAEQLLAHGLPAAAPDLEASDSVIVDGVCRRFSDEVTDVLLEASTSVGGRVARQTRDG